MLIFQDMLETVTRDIMMEDHISRCELSVESSLYALLMLYHCNNNYNMSLSFTSLVDSIHGGSGFEIPFDQQYQLFASAGAINFPIDPITEAWKEKVHQIRYTLQHDKYLSL